MRYRLGRLRQLVLEAFSKAYDILGVPASASADEIRRAYKTKALDLHPDRNPGDKDVADRMVKLNVAYDLLSDPKKRIKYDLMGDRTLGDTHGTKPSPSPQQTDVVMRRCQTCDRKVAMPNGRYVNHYTQPGGHIKCPGSGKMWDPWADQPKPPPRPEPKAEPSRFYYTYVQGKSSKFWECEVIGKTMYVRWGRIGSQGQTKAKQYSYETQALRAARGARMSKVSKGYVRTEPPVTVPRPSVSTAAASGPREPKQGTGKPTKDTYKVYGWKNHRRVVRVGGKLYGTQMGGKLKDGGWTKFNADDRAKVSPHDDGRMKVSKPTSDHSQVWDPVEEAVQAAIDDLIIEALLTDDVG